MSQKERTTVAAEAQAAIKTTPDTLAALLGGGADVGPVDGVGTGAVGNRPTLKALVDLANSGGSEQGGGTPAAKPKAKSKAKAKAKNGVGSQLPKTPAEQRQAIRSLIDKVYHYVCYPFIFWNFHLM